MATLLSAAGKCAQARVAAYPQKSVRITAGSVPGGAVDFTRQQFADVIRRDLPRRGKVVRRRGSGSS